MLCNPGGDAREAFEKLTITEVECSLDSRSCYGRAVVGFGTTFVAGYGPFQVLNVIRLIYKGIRRSMSEIYFM